MVTRKVARSKRDAMAMAETQLRDSGSDREEEIKAAVEPKRRRASKAESMAIARAAKAEKLAKAKAAAQQDLGGKPCNRPTSGGISSSGSMAPEAAPVVRPPPVAVPVTTTAPPTASSAATTPRASIGTRNGGSRRGTPTSVAASIRDGVVPVAFLRDELERKLQFIDPAIQARFGQLVWAKRAAFPYWPALILDPRLLPDHELPSALKELDEKCWVQLFGSRDIRQILFSALAAWDDKTHPYRDGFPRGDFNRLARLKDTFSVALNEASEQEKLTADERLKVFTTEVVPSLGLPLLQAPLSGFRKRRKAGNVPAPGTPPAPASSSTASTADVSSTTQLSQGNGLPHKAKSASTEVEKRNRITQEIRGGEPKSRYRLGQLSDYAAKLRSILENQSPERDWRVQLHISQLLDEKAFLREDLEKDGIWELLDQLRGNENVRWRDLVETVWNHLTNCTLDEWPSLQRVVPAPNNIPPSRRASTPLLVGAKRGPTDSTRERTGGYTTTQVTSTETAVGNGRSTVEAMAEAVARSMISRSTVMPQPAFRMANLAPRPDTVTNATTSSPPSLQLPSVSSSSTPSQAPFLSSSSAMTSVGINPGVPDTAPVGTLLFAVPAAALGTSAAPSTPSSSQQQSEKRISSQPTATRQLTASSGRTSHPTSAPPRGAARANHRQSSSPAASPMVSAPAPPSMQRDAIVSRSNPSLVIFNKDGTLLEFQTTWASWVESQAWRLGTALGASVRDSFFEALGYNEPTRTMRKGGVFNTTPKHELGPRFAVNFLLKYGLEYAEAVRLVNQHWSLPKEIATFRARRDLPSLFTTIRELGVKIAILTTDRRAVTSKTLTHLGVAHLVDLVSCGDDGVANTADRIWSICSRLGVSTANTVMVGDTADDMVLGRTAGCALSVGVLGGASDLGELSAHADFLVPCVTNVIKLLYQYRHQAAAL